VALGETSASWPGWMAKVMGRILLVCRLAARDLRHRPAEAIPILLAICAASATLTVGLVLNGVTGSPYAATRAATRGPDVVAAGTTSASLTALAGAPGVTGHSGPYPVAGVMVRAGRVAAPAEAEGRAITPVSVDQPKLIQGSWVRPGSVVVERSFAQALGVRLGETIGLNGRWFIVSGIAVSAAMPEFPQVCYDILCNAPALHPSAVGLVWVTEADARTLATRANPLDYLLNLRLADPADATAFVSAHSSPAPSAPSLFSWQTLSGIDGLLVADEQQVLSAGSWLLALLALASVAVLAVGRIAEQNRRVGLLKAAGSTPELVAAVLLAEYLGLALVGAAAGLAAGRLAATWLTSPGGGLVGAPGAPTLSVRTAALVIVAALATALAAALVPVIRGSTVSTVAALADTARAPRRGPLLIAVSARLPVPMMLGLRLISRRPRRAALSTAGSAIIVTGLVAVLTLHATSDEYGAAAGVSDPVAVRLSGVILVLGVVVGVLTGVNAIVATWATVLEARQPAALARAFGATPYQLAAGLSAAQLIPALPGVIIGIPAGLGLFAALDSGGSETIPPATWLAAVAVGTLLVLAVLTAIPARIGAQRPVAAILQAEMA
jgi:putative ABC transport system permease protein